MFMVGILVGLILGVIVGETVGVFVLLCEIDFVTDKDGVLVEEIEGVTVIVAVLVEVLEFEIVGVLLTDCVIEGVAELVAVVVVVLERESLMECVTEIVGVAEFDGDIFQREALAECVTEIVGVDELEGDIFQLDGVIDDDKVKFLALDVTETVGEDVLTGLIEELGDIPVILLGFMDIVGELEVLLTKPLICGEEELPEAIKLLVKSKDGDIETVIFANTFNDLTDGKPEATDGTLTIGDGEYEVPDEMLNLRADSGVIRDSIVSVEWERMWWWKGMKIRITSVSKNPAPTTAILLLVSITTQKRMTTWNYYYKYLLIQFLRKRWDIEYSLWLWIEKWKILRNVWGVV